MSPSNELTIPADGSTDSTLKNVSSRIPRSRMIGWTIFEALSIVNARFNGDASTTSLRSRMPRSRRCSSSSIANSTGAGGHLYGMPATPITILPPENVRRAARSRSASVSE